MQPKNVYPWNCQKTKQKKQIIALFVWHFTLGSSVKLLN